MTELPDDGPALTDEEEAALRRLDFPAGCSHEDCHAPATRTLHAFHRAPQGLGYAEECMPSRYGFCDRHARSLSRLFRRLVVVRCYAHVLPVVTRWTDGPPA